MFKNNKGFTLIEIVVAIGLMVVLGAFTIVSLSAVPQARMKEAAQTLKKEFELTRDYARTHGGDAMIEFVKVDDGLQINRSGKNITTETTTIDDRNIVLYYTITDDEEKHEYKLGEDDFPGNEKIRAVQNGTLQMSFTQTEGSIIGPHLVDYIIISNGSKNYKFVIQHDSGSIYYDYELEDNMAGENKTQNKSKVSKPTFVVGGALTTDIVVIQQDTDGNSVQPEINYDAKRVKIGGVYRAVDKGTYSITFSLKDPYSTTWSDGSTDVIQLVWKIE